MVGGEGGRMCKCNFFNWNGTWKEEGWVTKFSRKLDLDAAVKEEGYSPTQAAAV